MHGMEKVMILDILILIPDHFFSQIHKIDDV